MVHVLVWIELDLREIYRQREVGKQDKITDTRYTAVVLELRKKECLHSGLNSDFNKTPSVCT